PLPLLARRPSERSPSQPAQSPPGRSASIPGGPDATSAPPTPSSNDRASPVGPPFSSRSRIAPWRSARSPAMSRFAAVAAASRAARFASALGVRLRAGSPERAGGDDVLASLGGAL